MRWALLLMPPFHFVVDSSSEEPCDLLLVVSLSESFFLPFSSFAWVPFVSFVVLLSVPVIFLCFGSPGFRLSLLLAHTTDISISVLAKWIVGRRRRRF